MGDGNIQLSGRIDHQVKIRGNRIELGEIENCLLNHSDIKEAVVIKKEENHQPYLCAYFSTQTGLTVTQLREYLAGHLPGYMIPSYFVPVKKLPYTTAGKIDRQSLPDPKETINKGKTCEPPANRVEEKILEIWAGVLGLEAGKIGVLDNFFELGGNSITILKIQNRINKEFGLDISMNTLFQGPTIRKIAAGIHKESDTNKLRHIVRLNKGSGKKNMFIFHPLHGMTYQYKELAQLLEGYWNVYGIQAKGLSREERLPSGIDRMLADYLPQIKAVQEKGPYVLAGYCVGNILAYETARILEDQDQTVENAIMLDAGAFIPEVMVSFYRMRKLIHQTSQHISGLLKRAVHVPIQESPAVPRDEIQKLKQQVEANSKAIAKKYKYKRIIHSPITAIRASDNHRYKITRQQWIKMTTGSVIYLESPGNHDTMFAPPNVEKLAEIFKQLLDRR